MYVGARHTHRQAHTGYPDATAPVPSDPARVLRLLVRRRRHDCRLRGSGSRDDGDEREGEAHAQDRMEPELWHRDIRYGPDDEYAALRHTSRWKFDATRSRCR